MTKKKQMPKIQLTNDLDLIIVLVDDEYNPFRFSLPLKEAEELNKKLTDLIERIKDENRNFRP